MQHSAASQWAIAAGFSAERVLVEGHSVCWNAPSAQPDGQSRQRRIQLCAAPRGAWALVFCMANVQVGPTAVLHESSVRGRCGSGCEPGRPRGSLRCGWPRACIGGRRPGLPARASPAGFRDPPGSSGARVSNPPRASSTSRLLRLQLGARSQRTLLLRLAANRTHSPAAARRPMPAGCGLTEREMRVQGEGDAGSGRGSSALTMRKHRGWERFAFAESCVGRNFGQSNTVEHDRSIKRSQTLSNTVEHSFGRRRAPERCLPRSREWGTSCRGLRCWT